MSNFDQVKNKYLSMDFLDLGYNQLSELRKVLQTVESKDLLSIEDHKAYLSILNKFRKTVAKNDELNGKNYRSTLTSLLSVGANSIYASDLRFIYELIQNVDDCSYINPSDCELLVHFDWNKGTITFKYNEEGFKPHDVFALTGIAEESKNISPEKIEIGEKGIGFKSVFGIADKVLIQSGKFSFMLSEENFTVPELKYDNFDGIEGTKLTLFVKSEAKTLQNEYSLIERSKTCRKIFNRLVNIYTEKDVLFNNNPVLFLNKLTKIKFFYDGFDCLEFTVDKGREKENIHNGLTCEEEVVISSLISSRDKNIEKQKNSIMCTRYTKPIEYNRNMCVSRYGDNTAFDCKKMSMQIVVPNPECVYAVGMGAFYSFLPTKIRTTVPVSCHIPFKLDSSREHIDSQGENEWFRHSRDEFSKMLGCMYEDLSHKVKNSILLYVPRENCCFFSLNSGSDKERCLEFNGFFGQKILQRPIFFTEENNYKSNKEIFCFDDAENIIDPLSLCLLLESEKELFIPPKNHGWSLSCYGIEVINDIYAKLLNQSLKNGRNLRDVLNIIDDADIHYSQLIGKIKPIILSIEAIKEISKHPKCLKAFNDCSIKNIKEKKALDVEIRGDFLSEEIKYIISKEEPINDTEFVGTVANYFSNIKFRYAKISFEEQMYFVAKNILVLSEKNYLDVFADFCRDVNKNDLFSANIKMRAASDRLNNVNDSLSVVKYMELLHEVRKAIKVAFGNTTYDSYIKVIRELNAEPQRFIRELLQNADDCLYPETVVPSFDLEIEGNVLKTSYNEKGFTKENARSITAIGESTKKKIVSGQFEIGEKGIGFKTVFAVADSVDIHSGEFHFNLEAATPTIPSIIDPIDSDNKGTSMIFKLRNGMFVNFTIEQVIELCLCLRKLKDININGIKIQIEDLENKRVISIAGRKYEFFKFIYPFTLNTALLKERNEGGKKVGEKQEIVLYIPDKDIPKLKYYIYSGLPTAIELGVPLSIDAPFELTASRDNVLRNAWNEKVSETMYRAYASAIEEIAPKIRIKVMQYIRFIAQQYGSLVAFSILKNSEDGWLNNSQGIGFLKTRHFIPTYDDKFFAQPGDVTVLRYPPVIHNMFSKTMSSYELRKIIDNTNEDYDKKLLNLGCKAADFERISNIICNNAYLYMNNEKVRTALYKYLEQTEELRQYTAKLRKARIIPVKGRTSSEGTTYISYQDEKIYVDPNAYVSPSEYRVLETNLLSKAVLEKILNVDIQVMDDLYKKSLYEDKIKQIILSTESNAEKYKKLICELKTNKHQFTEDANGILLIYRNSIPLLTVGGEYKIHNRFVSSFEPGYFCGNLLNSHIVAKEAEELAKLIGCKDIGQVLYDELEVHNMLLEDDIEDLQMVGMRYGFQILENCIFDGFVLESLVEKYNLSGLKRVDFAGVFDEDDFPNERVKDHCSLKMHIDSQSRNVRKIIKEEEPRVVDKICLPNGKKILLNGKEARDKTINRYKPSLNTDGCFCQMCRSVKSSEYIEVNNIESKPEYYWPQLRVALCLECSKKFETMRNNKEIMDKFYKNIMRANTYSDEPIVVQIGNADIKFTQTHLAEIQEILKQDKL